MSFLFLNLSDIDSYEVKGAKPLPSWEPPKPPEEARRLAQERMQSSLNGENSHPATNNQDREVKASLALLNTDN